MADKPEKSRTIPKPVDGIQVNFCKIHPVGISESLPAAKLNPEEENKDRIIT
jgi:hypothetical protein